MSIASFSPNIKIWEILVALFLLYFGVYSEIWKLLPFFPNFKIGEKGSNFHISLYTVKYYKTDQLEFPKF